MARLTSQVAIIGAGRLLNMAAAAGTMIVLARIMPDKESYGAVMLLIMLYVMLSQIFAAGLPQAVYYFLPRMQGSEQRGLIWQILVLLALSGLLLGSILFAGAHSIGHLLGAPGLTPLLRVFAFYPVFMMPTLALEGTLLFYNRPVTTVIFSALLRLGMFCSLVIPTWLQVSLPVTVGIWVAEAGVMCLLALVLMSAALPRGRATWHSRVLRDVWGFSLPLAMLTVINLSSSYLDRLVVSHFFGAAAFGAYANATMEIPTVTMVTSATSVVLLAEFSRRTAAGEYAELLAVWHRASIKTAILILASMGFLVIWAHEVMRILYSSRFAESGTIFSIYVWCIPCYLFGMRSLYIAAGSTRILNLLSLLDLVISILCVTVFGRLFGLPGVAIGALASAVISVPIWVHVFVRRVTRIGWQAFMPWRTLLLTLVIALAAGAVTWPLRLLTAMWPMPVVFGLALVAYVLIYLAGLSATGLIEYIIPARRLLWRVARRETRAPSPVAVTDDA